MSTTGAIPPPRKVFTPADIDPQWLSEVLSMSGKRLTVASVVVDPPIEGMSVKHRLHITYQDDGGRELLPPTMVVKGSFGRQGPEWDWVYETEMKAYRDFLPSSIAPAPYTYFADHEPKKGAPIILMEDLMAKNVKFNDIHSSLTYAQAAGFLDAFARYHARYWGGPELREGGTFAWTVPLISGFVLDYFARITSPPSWNKYLAMPRGTTVPRIFRDGARMNRAILNLVDFQKATPWCIVHGDCHFGNTYLYSDGRPGFVDWQIKRGPWHQDISYFLVSALDIVDRREWDVALIEYYISRLSAYGVKAPSFSEAFLAYRADIMYGLVIWICNGDDNNEFQREPINTGNTARFVAAALDHGTLAILGVAGG